MPLPQGVHAPAPESAEYVPALQEAHVVGEEAPIAELAVPRPQGVQVGAPLEGAKVPLLQGTQVLIPDTPAALPGGQGEHVEALTAPSADDALPGGQRVQDSAPKPVW